MSSAKKKKDENQPELPIEGAPKPVSAEPKPAKRAAKTGNGADHIVATEGSR